MTENIAASDLALAHLRMQGTRDRMRTDDPNYKSTVEAVDDLARALSAIAEATIREAARA